MYGKVLTVKKDDTIGEVAHVLSENNIGGVPVVDADNKIVGIITEKDLLYKDIEPRVPAAVNIQGATLFLEGISRYRKELKKLVATRAEDIMTRDVITVDENTEVERVARIMVESDITRVPVVNNGKLVGIISRADIVKHIAKTLE